MKYKKSNTKNFTITSLKITLINTEKGTFFFMYSSSSNKLILKDIEISQN